MPWWGITLIGLGAFGLGVTVGYGLACLQVGKGFNW